MKPPPFINVFNLISTRSDSKSSAITSSALSVIMIFMLLLLECITLSSSLSLKTFKVYCYRKLVFRCIRFFEIIYNIF